MRARRRPHNKLYVEGAVLNFSAWSASSTGDNRLGQKSGFCFGIFRWLSQVFVMEEPDKLFAMFASNLTINEGTNRYFSDAVSFEL